jgi:ribosomal protein S18 acetylase RimI-like enzyme
MDRFEELVSFVARLNSDGTHHIGFFDEGEAEVRASLAECLIPTAEGFRLAYEGDQLVGVFGVAPTRLTAPGCLISLSMDWHTIADRLCAEVLALIPVDIGDYDLFCDVQNIHMEAFAARHGFPSRSENAVMTMARQAYRPSAKRQTQVIVYQDDFFEPFDKLHKVLFPNAYFTARQMIEKLDENHRLFLGIEEGQLLAYHFCKIEPESESGYVDFIGTDSAARGRGIGADLLASGLDWMLSASSITKKVSLTRADNVPARSLYEKFGFVTERVMRAIARRLVEIIWRCHA